MLLLEEQFESNSVTLFRDHVSAATFHYMPGNPQVVVDGGRTLAQLMRFRSSAQGGGFLTVQVQLGLDPRLLHAVEADLSTRFGVQPNLVPVLFQSGTVRLSILGFEPTLAPGSTAQNRLVEAVLGVSKPSLFGSVRAIFEVQLTEEAAVLMERAWRTGTAPATVVYDLSFSGLRPARGLRATVQYKMAYEYLRTRLASNCLCFKEDVDSESESLRRNGLITIEDVDFTGIDADLRAKREEEVRATLSEMTQGLFFRPAVSPVAMIGAAASNGAAMDTYWAAQGRPQAAFLMRNLNQQEEDTLTYDLTETRVATRNISPQGALRLPSQSDVSTLILDATLSWPPPITLVHAFALPEANWSGVAALEINLRRQAQVNTIVLTPLQPDQTVKIAEGPVEYNVVVKANRSSEDLGSIPKPDLTFRPLTTSNVILDPLVLSGRRELRLALGAVDLQMVSKVTGTLATKAGDQRTFQLDASTSEAVIAIWGSEPVQMETAFALFSGDRLRANTLVAPGQTFAVINQPPDEFHVVTLMLQDPLARYSSVAVTLEAAEDGSRQNLVLDHSTEMLIWSARRDKASSRTYRYKVRKVLSNALVVDEDWVEGSGSLLTVGDLDLRLETVQGFLLGFEGVLGGVVKLTSANPPEGVDGTQEILIEEAQNTFSAVIPFARSAPRRYTVSGQILVLSGAIELAPRDETSEVLLITAPRTTASRPAP